MTHIQIIAGPGNGKTCLAQLIGQTGLDVITENFDDNPFVKIFYKDQKGHAFEKEITFVMQHYHDIKHGVQNHANAVFDFSLCLDKAYAMTTLNVKEFHAFDAVYTVAQEKLPQPDLLIHLHCPIEVERERMLARGRGFEQNVRLEFLQGLENAIERVLEERRSQVKILSLDSHAYNFVENQEHQKDVLKLIFEALNMNQGDIMAKIARAVA